MAYLGMNTNYTNFFSSSSKYNSGLYSMYGDYASIRSGSYKKLLKAHYANESKDTNSKHDSAISSLLNGKLDSTATEVKADADALKNSAKALTTKGKDSLFKKKEMEITDASTGTKTKVMDYDRDAITKAVKSFVDDYNDLLDSSVKSKNTKVLRNAVHMTNQVKAYTKSLASIGITKGADNKLAVDEKKLQDVDVSKIANLFNGQNSFAEQMGRRAEQMSKDVMKSQTSSLYGSRGMYNPYNYNNFETYM